MKRQVLFVHSAGAQGPYEGSGPLVTWLKAALGEGYQVLYPKMPHPENPDHTAWSKALANALASAPDGVILVGHSLGGSVLLKYLSEHTYGKSIAGLFLVATPYWGEKVAEFMLPDDFPSKLPPLPSVFLYHSEDDAVVPVTHVTRYAEKLPQAVVQKLSGRGHQFERGLPELAEDIKSL